MNIIGHAASALPFVFAGNYVAAAGCVAPDITWIANEVRFRASGCKDWHQWSKELCEKDVFWYRIAHSALLVAPVCVVMGWHSFLFGWAVHILLDLPTHSGFMAQQPFYPLKWRWKWTVV